jgi:hypothetical protein
MKKIIHVNQHNIKRNRKNDSHDPVITVKTYKSNRYAHGVIIKDKEDNEVARLIYSPNKPLSCGAEVWLETRMEVEIIQDG